MKYSMLKYFFIKLRILAFQGQKILAYISHFISSFFINEDKDLWVVGVQEIANYLNFLSKSISHTYTVNIVPNRYYQKNDYNFRGLSNKWINLFIITFYLPILFGYLSARSGKFIYFWNTSFLFNDIDGRDFEFSFLKKQNKFLIVSFLGSDIRSPKLSLEHGISLGQETMMSNLLMIRPDLFTEDRENFLKSIASSADKYADHIFNAPVDQISYLQRQVHPFLYFYPDENFCRNDSKFEKMDIIKIIHAPSSPVIKGTPIVRSVVKKLQAEGYKFDYCELINIDNNDLINELRTAHIVINELYAFVPGVLSIEAMAAHCAVLTSGDADIEILPSGANQAWLKTRYWELYDHLRHLLDNKDQIKKYADQGYEWAWRECRTTIAKQKFFQAIDKTK